MEAMRKRAHQLYEMSKKIKDLREASQTSQQRQILSRRNNLASLAGKKRGGGTDVAEHQEKNVHYVYRDDNVVATVQREKFVEHYRFHFSDMLFRISFKNRKRVLLIDSLDIISAALTRSIEFLQQEVSQGGIQLALITLYVKDSNNYNAGNYNISTRTAGKYEASCSLKPF